MSDRKILWECDHLICTLRLEAAERERNQLEQYLRRQWEWSGRTFGLGMRTEGICKHIEKELAEIRENPHDLSEWIDVVILALDGYWRHGGTPEQLLADLQAKQDKNFARKWPEPGPEDQPTEHVRTGENNSLRAENARLRGVLEKVRPYLEPTPTYGCFHGGDPRKFSPDSECCTEQELSNHKADCAKWDAGEVTEVPVSGWNADGTIHVTRSAYGLGIYYYEEPETKALRELIDAALAASEAAIHGGKCNG